MRGWLYIKGAGCISPQQTFGTAEFLPEIIKYAGNRMMCIEPDYSSYFDAGNLRRMSRMIKFSTAAGLAAIKDAGIIKLDAISTGTGYGLLENSEKFLKSMAEASGTVLSPTAFIQSTHNTVSSAIALITGCNGHNNTFSHKGFSFESALVDARLLVAEGCGHILVGGHDELSEKTFALMELLHIFRHNNNSGVHDYLKNNQGIVPGEGAAFFVLSPHYSESDYGLLMDNDIFYNPGSTEAATQKIESFLEKNELVVGDIDIVISGLNGDAKLDNISGALNERYFTQQTICLFKHLCGEYMTASSFGFWLAAKMMQSQQVPDGVVLKNRNRKPQYILLYNVFQNDHSLMLFRSC